MTEIKSNVLNTYSSQSTLSVRLEKLDALNYLVLGYIIAIELYTFRNKNLKLYDINIAYANIMTEPCN